MSLVTVTEQSPSKNRQNCTLANVVGASDFWSLYIDEYELVDE